MSDLSHLALLHADPKAVAALSFGFEREGTRVLCTDSAESLDKALSEGSQLIIIGARTREEAKEKLALAQGVMAGAGVRVPVLYFGNAIDRADALAEGASEFITQPAFIRDVVTLGKLMATPTVRRTQSISGELSEHFGLFYLVRALSKISYTGVLTLIRGLRRGELRFFEGEVTSGQIGALHGLAALHQVLLWTNARFDLREEKVVRRRQIPLEKPELLKDCERFLNEIRSVAGGLSPSAVLVRDEERDTSQLPKQVAEVLRLFDGTGSVADVIEDSPYRVFETLRIACRLAEKGLVRRTTNTAPKHLMHTALAIEEWLVGGEVGAPVPPEDSRPIGPAKGEPASPPRKKKRGKKNKTQPVPIEASVRTEHSWSDLLPSPHASEDMSQVVPSTDAVGEILASPNASGAPPAGVERTTSALGNVVIDQSLMSSDAASEGSSSSLSSSMVAPEGTEPLASGPEPASWEEQTAPATRHAISESGNPWAQSEIKAIVADLSAHSAADQGPSDKVEVQSQITPAPEDEAPQSLPVLPPRGGKTGAQPDKAKLAAKPAPARVTLPGVAPHVETKPEPLPSPPPEEAVSAKAEPAATQQGADAAADLSVPKAEAPQTELTRATSEGGGRSVSGELSSPVPRMVSAEERGPASAAGSAPDGITPSIVVSDEVLPAADTIRAPYDPDEVREAHKSVAQTALDAAQAVNAAMQIAALVKKKNGAKRPDSRSEKDAQDVASVAAAATEASFEASHFSDDEEAFFSRGTAQAKSPVIPTENFEDLDEHYELPRTFWQRFMADPNKDKRKK